MKYLCGLFCSFLPLVGNSAVFSYDLHVVSIPGVHSRTMVCFHGYGGSYKIAENIKGLGLIDATLVAFNFPDHDLEEREYDARRASFGTIDELLPALYVLKTQVIDLGLDSIDLYGYSAGGAAVVNALGVLQISTYDDALATIGIRDCEKERLLDAIQRGLIILDAPLKSVEEIIDFRGTSPELEILAKNYRDNHFRPIDTLEFLQGLSLNIILHFQESDEIISNRDDVLYIERVKKFNQRGTTSVIIGNDGGHLAPHLSLWQFISKEGDRLVSGGSGRGCPRGG